jgi:molybdopterin synthase sulfur carrier subunit
MMTIKVRFFASLRERVGCADVELPADDLASVADAWSAATDGSEAPGNTLAALNMEYVGFDALLADGDEVAFFPPVTGGGQ